MPITNYIPEKPVFQQFAINERQVPEKYQWPNQNNLENERYVKLVHQYGRCITLYLQQYESPQFLEKQLTRRDLDTVCAYELYNLKKSFLETKTLDLSEFTKHHN